ncbi:hypothetical protein Metev_1296 [Methanohalobium evestigatum Z-7303]|uniref:FCP1 homology domain-containing protein n=1 Tax=Methanohalobium evestigatum (strain ATCC BAA-1072 / DSM 3721 / NBRC 107634 / OCM 161 / Z-7303) TaxID=644295 RepID=D7E7T5_METEZ|nr:hypothetical protein [Methanohalobium evestigatum]ADI74158.1 hypothetical protein Metev_1296 [Methanohalobium evestigatum Z-7303]
MVVKKDYIAHHKSLIWGDIIHQIYVFDLDDTLATPDKEADRKSYFMEIDHLEPVPTMIQFFNETKSRHPTMILTTRHPDLKPKIEDMFECTVECRNFCLTWKEILEALSTDDNLNDFMTQMINWKTGVLNQLSEQYRKVIFFDDLVHRYDVSSLKDNIDLKKPLHLSDGEHPGFLYQQK